MFAQVWHDPVILKHCLIKNIMSFSVLLAITFSISTCSGKPSCDTQPSLKILFVGNSYTSINNVPNLVKGIACDHNINLDVTSIAPGGASFAKHVINHKSDRFISTKHWDYIVLQNQSVTPSQSSKINYRHSVPRARILVKAAKTVNSNAKVVYFVTWGREKGGVFCRFGSSCDFHQHTKALLKGYSEYAQATGGKLAKIGSAWKFIVDDPNAPFDPGDLWRPDGSHAELIGSYLAAAVIAAETFDISPIGSTLPDGISDGNGEYVLEVVNRIVGN